MQFIKGEAIPVPLPGLKVLHPLIEVHSWSACTLTSFKQQIMKKRSSYSLYRMPESKIAFISRLILRLVVIFALAVSFLLSLKRISNAISEYHARPQTASQQFSR